MMRMRLERFGEIWIAVEASGFGLEISLLRLIQSTSHIDKQDILIFVTLVICSSIRDTFKAEIKEAFCCERNTPK